MQVFAGQQVSHWDFPRDAGSVALMTRFGCENGLAAADVLNGSGLSETDLHDHDRMIIGRQELTVVRIPTVAPSRPAVPAGAPGALPTDRDYAR